MTESESLKDVLTSIFRRRGALTLCTRLFDELPDSVQANILASVELRGKELPVISCKIDARRWVLLTTERLFYCDAQALTSIENREIADATIDIVSDMAAGARNKQECKTLVISLRSRQQHRIEFESGAPLIGFWNILKHLSLRSGTRAH